MSFLIVKGKNYYSFTRYRTEIIGRGYWSIWLIVIDFTCTPVKWYKVFIYIRLHIRYFIILLVSTEDRMTIRAVSNC